ncbi:MAG: hypothetical protein L0Y36_08155 [Planctomycetales bacterium]|nr:hypothetical protein [Planctomycetales bacterium]
MTSGDLEKYSSAITLSDMEVFVFPELMYSLVLANIMSPVIWKWRENPTFQKLEGKSIYRRLMRMRQYVMDEYEFNLDLDTWGLTHKDVELNRFKDFLSPEDIARSNALFGYTGDTYYFDVDIRRHFGLDKYNSDIIPYWKTETVEAMDAFRLKAGYTTGAGECVSLSTLYAAAAFIVCGLPLEDIYLVLTPLHSQNFFDISDGIITNNRRLVTKPMWFNGTEISDKAQRALRNEQVTIVAHHTGQIHCFYNQATIAPQRYRHFRQRLQAYLTSHLNHLNVANFLRLRSQYQKYFQFCRHRRGERMFVKAEKLFGYEHGSRYRIYDETFEKLLDDVSEEDYLIYPHTGRICCEQLMAFVEHEKTDIHTPLGRDRLARFIAPYAGQDAEPCIREMAEFLQTLPQLPDDNKQYQAAEPIMLDSGWSRQEIVEYLESMRSKNTTADLAFYAFRDMTRCDWRPFIKAAMERSPVSAEKYRNKGVDDIYSQLCQFPDDSIYEGPRLAQPDEVANYGVGDGIEKAFSLAAILHQRQPEQPLKLDSDGKNVILRAESDYAFSSAKGLKKHIRIEQGAYQAHDA